MITPFVAQGAPQLDVQAAVPTWRVQQRESHIAVWVLFADRLWEIVIPDVDAPLDVVRIQLSEVGSSRGAEASCLMPRESYEQARNWLRFLPEGACGATATEPALSLILEAFGPLLGVFSEMGRESSGALNTELDPLHNDRTS